jgi:hypothetical protein
MKHWRKPLITGAVLSVPLLLAACSGESAAPGESPAASAVDTPAPTVSGSLGTPAVSVSPSPTAGARPDARSIEVMTPEGYQKKEAKLQQGSGYSFYMFDGFSFDPANGRLSLSGAPEHYAVIELLPADFSVEALRKQGQGELGKFGETREYTGELVEHPLRFTELYLQVSAMEGVWDYMVWKSENGNPFLFRLHNPEREGAARFAQPVQVMLSTVEAGGKP